MRRQKRGISSVIGAAIAVAIFFTVIVPLWVFMQNAQTLFMDETTRRFQFEIERLNEKLDIHISLERSADAFNRRQLYLILRNPGSLHVTVPTVYVESSLIGLNRINVNVSLTPGQLIVMPLDFLVSANPPDSVSVRAVTLRGNSFTAPESGLGPTNLPYLMIVGLGNMTQGYRYKVEVQAIGAYGCVAAEAGQFAVGCQEVAAEYRWAETFTDQQAVAAFAIPPGDYVVRLIQYRWTGSTWGSETVVESLLLEDVFDDKTVRFHLAQPSTPLPVPVRVSVTQPNTIWVLTGQSDGNVRIPFRISLGNESEPLRNVLVKLTVNTVQGLTAPSAGSSQTIDINRLSPGETYNGLFVISVTDNTNTDNTKFGGSIIYRIEIVQAVGEDSGLTYTPSQMAGPSLTNLQLSFCRRSTTSPPNLICSLT